MGHDLRVRLRGQHNPGRSEFITQFSEVLDDAVVDDRHAAVLTDMRMGVSVRGASVRGPACVANAHRGGLEWITAEKCLEIDEFACLFAHLEMITGDHCHTGRVISAVLQAPQAFDYDLKGLLFADVSHDPAHGCQGTRGRVGPAHPGPVRPHLSGVPVPGQAREPGSV